MSSIGIFYDQIATTYFDSRPSPPIELIDYLTHRSPSHRLAWDCGTGNGQVAVALAGHFRRVIGTDVAAEQLARAPRRANIEYRADSAERSRIKTGSVDLIVAGQAAHWFAGDAFFEEVNRVSRPSAVIAFWCYRTPTVTPDIDKLVEDLYASTKLTRYWPPEKRFIDSGYSDLPFPFREVSAPEFTMVGKGWVWERFESYLRTWPALHAVARTPDGAVSIAEEMTKLARAWGDRDQPRDVCWQLWLRVGVSSHRRGT